MTKYTTVLANKPVGNFKSLVLLLFGGENQQHFDFCRDNESVVNSFVFKLVIPVLIWHVEWNQGPLTALSIVISLWNKSKPESVNFALLEQIYSESMALEDVYLIIR